MAKGGFSQKPLASIHGSEMHRQHHQKTQGGKQLCPLTAVVPNNLVKRLLGRTILSNEAKEVFHHTPPKARCFTNVKQGPKTRTS